MQRPEEGGSQATVSREQFDLIFESVKNWGRWGCWRPRCLHMSRQHSVSTARQASMNMAVLSPRR
jgi:hypothetical protein